jgi:energy-converting hydrogenase Eha subunit A
MKKNDITIVLVIKPFLVCLIMLLSTISYSQIYYGIELQEDEKTYVVSLQSDQTIPFPLNTTGTAQITIKLLSTDSFEVANLTSLVPNVSWSKTVRRSD